MLPLKPIYTNPNNKRIKWIPRPPPSPCAGSGGQYLYCATLTLGSIYMFRNSFIPLSHWADLKIKRKYLFYFSNWIFIMHKSSVSNFLSWFLRAIEKLLSMMWWWFCTEKKNDIVIRIWTWNSYVMSVGGFWNVCHTYFIFVLVLP